MVEDNSAATAVVISDQASPSIQFFSMMEETHAATSQGADEGYEEGSDWLLNSMPVCRKPDLDTYWNMKNGLKCMRKHRTMTVDMR